MTDGWAAQRAGNSVVKIGEPSEDGYSHSHTVMNYSYNSQGQLLDARSDTVTQSSQLVFAANNPVDGAVAGDVSRDWQRGLAAGEEFKIWTVDGDGNASTDGAVYKIASYQSGEVGEHELFVKAGQTFVSAGKANLGTTNQLTIAGQDVVFDDAGRLFSVALGDLVGYVALGDSSPVALPRPQIVSIEAVTTNRYAVIGGVACLSLSQTDSWAAQLNGKAFVRLEDSGTSGFNRNQSTVQFQYNAVGQLLSASGGTVGSSNTEMWVPQRTALGKIEGDVDEDEFYEQGETWVYSLTDQARVSEVVNTYSVVLGRPVVMVSDARSWAATRAGNVLTKIDNPNTSGYSLSGTTVKYEVNAQGALVNAGGARLVHTNDNQAARIEESSTLYAVRLGQAAPKTNVTETWAGTINAGVFEKVTDSQLPEYSYSKTVVPFSYEAHDLLIGQSALGRTGTETWVLKAQGQSIQVPMAPTAPSGQSPGSNNSANTSQQNNNQGTNRIESSGSALQNLPNRAIDIVRGIEGETLDLRSKSEDFDRTVTDGGEGEKPNPYAEAREQAILLSSEMETISVHEDEGRFVNETDKTKHGYMHSLSQVQYSYNAAGQLTGAKGTSRSEQTSDVVTLVYVGDVIKGDLNNNGIKEKGEVWETKLVSQSTVTETSNSYEIIQGNAVVLESTTENVGRGVGKRQFRKVKSLNSAPEDQGYVYSKMHVYYSYNEKGLLVGAKGRGTSKSESKVFNDVWNDADGDKKIDAGEVTRGIKVITSTSNINNTYIIVNGEALVSESRRTPIPESERVKHEVQPVYRTPMTPRAGWCQPRAGA
ncbi:MAG: hypothetical protein IPN90_04285 [Elusimicrobia bacterium]|nr:hypothetical protein [Elusimicrobiota bacterium]